MSDNTHQESVEPRRSVDPLVVDECFHPPHVTIGINDPITARRRVVSWFKKVHGVEPQDYSGGR